MAYDLKSAVHQSAVDKLFSSVTYPFTIFERSSPYEGLALAALDPTDLELEMAWRFDDSTIQSLLDEAGAASRYSPTGEDELSNAAEGLRSVFAEIATNSRECLGALRKLESDTDPAKPTWDGPDEAALKQIIDLAEDDDLRTEELKVLGDFGITALVTWIKVFLPTKPSLDLGGASVDIDLRVGCDGTGEVWLKYPWVQCVKQWHGICYKWKKVVKTKNILTVSLRGIKIKAEAKADFVGKGAIVQATGRFQKLRLDHKYLDQIPLEKVANSTLASKPVTAFDARKLIATVPIYESKFAVDSISIPNVADELLVEVTLKEI